MKCELCSAENAVENRRLCETCSETIVRLVRITEREQQARESQAERLAGREQPWRVSRKEVAGS